MIKLLRNSNRNDIINTRRKITTTTAITMIVFTPTNETMICFSFVTTEVLWKRKHRDIEVLKI